MDRQGDRTRIEVLVLVFWPGSEPETTEVSYESPVTLR